MHTTQISTVGLPGWGRIELRSVSIQFLSNVPWPWQEVGSFHRILILNQSYCLKTLTKFLVLQFSITSSLFLKNMNRALATLQPFQLVYLLFSLAALLFNCFSALSGWMPSGPSDLLLFCFLCSANNSWVDTSIFAHVSPWLPMKNNFWTGISLPLKVKTDMKNSFSFPTVYSL